MYSHILAILDAQTEANGAIPYVVGSCDGEEFECTTAEFLESNEFDGIMMHDVAEMAVGTSYSGGGGASAEWSITRIA